MKGQFIVYDETKTTEDVRHLALEEVRKIIPAARLQDIKLRIKGKRVEWKCQEDAD